jgi:hypothetical protein
MGDCFVEGEDEAFCLGECGLAEAPQSFTDLFDCVDANCAGECEF